MQLGLPGRTPWGCQGRVWQPPVRKERVVARSGGCGDLCHGLFQALVERGLGVIALTNYRGLGVLSLEVSIRARGAEGVVGEAGRHEQEASQEDRRQGHCVDHPVADARNDFKERAFARRAGGHGLGGFSGAQSNCENHSGGMALKVSLCSQDLSGLSAIPAQNSASSLGFMLKNPSSAISKFLSLTTLTRAFCSAALSRSVSA